MPTISKITLSRVLPAVFAGMEQSPAIAQSEVWLAPELEFHRGRRYMIAAESGCGKSSLLSFIYGNRTDYQGEIRFDQADIRQFTIGKWCALRTASLSILPQEMRIFPELTALENIEIKNQLTAHKTSGQILQMLDRLGIASKAHSPAGTMSIGQQQRLAIVRALCQPFDFLLLDEPVSHLDQRNNREVADMIAEEATAQGAGVIITSVGHNLLLPDTEIIHL